MATALIYIWPSFACSPFRYASCALAPGAQCSLVPQVWGDVARSEQAELAPNRPWWRAWPVCGIGGDTLGARPSLVDACLACAFRASAGPLGACTLHPLRKVGAVRGRGDFGASPLRAHCRWRPGTACALRVGLWKLALGAAPAWTLVRGHVGEVGRRCACDSCMRRAAALSGAVGGWRVPQRTAVG